MKIAVAKDQGQVSAHFGQSEAFQIYTIEDFKIKSQEVLQKSGKTGLMPGILKDLDVTVVIAGVMGQKAMDKFKQADIDLVVGVEGCIEGAVEKYIMGILESSDQTCQHTHQCGNHSC